MTEPTYVLAGGKPDEFLEGLRGSMKVTHEQLQGALVVYHLGYLADANWGVPLRTSAPTPGQPQQCRGGHYRRVAGYLTKMHGIRHLPDLKGRLPNPYLRHFMTAARLELERVLSWLEKPRGRALVERAINELEWQSGEEHRQEAAEKGEEDRDPVYNPVVEAKAYRAARGRADGLSLVRSLKEVRFDPAAIKWLRKSLSMRRAEFARVLGTSPTNIQRWEKGSPPQAQFLKRYQLLADMLGIERFNPLGDSPKPDTPDA